MKIQILIDNPDSWIVPYASILLEDLHKLGHQAHIVYKHKDVEKGDILCLLSCERKFKNLHLNKHNLVVHESNLPEGKGWSPVTWQILEGKNSIPVTLFEATEEIDGGNIYLKDQIKLNGDELLPEIKHKQGIITNNLITTFIKLFPNIKGKVQKGESSFYPRRTSADAELDVNKSIKSQFNLLRVVDNERYPAYFKHKGIKYIITIKKIIE